MHTIPGIVKGTELLQLCTFFVEITCYCSIELTSCYVEDGADLRHEDGEGCTPLHHAAREGNLQIATKLLELGAQVNILKYVCICINDLYINIQHI